MTELAALGVAALFVPFPFAVDDHQTSNARFLVDQGGGWLMPQDQLTPDVLAQFLQQTDRPALLARAVQAHTMQQLQATEAIVKVCEELTA